ncbi:MAG TPA: MlaD family protein [Candidatus Eisenbacteria bacterium]|nr:MlaD family protein [Candidatus Eisenbacteria bacterium]
MSRGRKANPALIGIFVLGAAILALAAVAILGSGRFFAQRQAFVCFFPGSVEGLNPGAPVKVRGVQIGQVTEMLLRYREQNLDQALVRLPVFIEVDERRLLQLGATRAHAIGTKEGLEELVKLGLRARLETQSLVTGVLYVGLDFFPDTEVVRVLPVDGPDLEIPTVPTTLEKVFASFEKVMRRIDAIDIDALMTSARNALDGVSQLTRSPDLERSIAELHKTLASIRGVTDSLQPQVQPTMKDLRAALAQAKIALEGLDKSLVSVQRLVEPSAPFVVDFSRTLAEVGDAARSIRVLADELDRKPNSLIFGR